MRRRAQPTREFGIDLEGWNGYDVRTMTKNTARVLLVWISSFNLVAAEPVEELVFENDFTKGIRFDRWSVTPIEHSPHSGERVLGRFHSHLGAKLNLKDLPPHQFLRLRATVVIIDSMDGNDEVHGPDTWHLIDDHAGTLIHTNFCNPRRDGEGADQTQCFPDSYPFAQHPQGTGAARTFNYGFPAQHDVIDDHEYDLDVIYPHRAQSLGLKFAGLCSRSHDESWALKNIQVSVLGGPSGVGEAALEKSWRDLRGGDPTKADRARWAFLAAGVEGRKFLNARASGADKEEQKRRMEAAEKVRAEFEKHLKALDKDGFGERQEAMAAILALGEDVVPLIEEARKKGVGAEAQKALAKISARFKKAERGGAQEALVAARVAQIERIFATVERGYTVTSSFDEKVDRHDSLAAVNDGIVPPASANINYPHFRWWPKTGTAEWLQYTFPEARKIGMAEVYWLIDPKRYVAFSPKSWSVEYLGEDGAWKAVPTKDTYKVEPDKFNRVRFPEIETTAVRLGLEQEEDVNTGLFEFRVGAGEK